MPLDADRFIWRASPSQQALIECPVFEVFFGGARGGGKTDGMLGDFVVHADMYGEHAIGLMVRRTRTELIETIERSKVIYPALGATYHSQEGMWRFDNGARLRFAYLERDSDADAYQGHSYTRVYVEEIGNFPSPAPILKLMATLRSGGGVPCRFRATGNPGGAGHQWVKARYIDPAPKGWKVTTENNRERVFIPSQVGDNPHLAADYVDNLRMSGSPELVRAWLEGDWNVIAGAFFPEFGAQHIAPACALPVDWPRFRSADWGSARPFSVGWWAISDGSLSTFPRGALVRYREWYGWNGKPNEGMKLTAEEVGAGILERDADDKVQNGASVLDPAAFANDGGPSIAERIHAGSGRKVDFRRADNRRIARMGAMGGWDHVRSRLKGEDGRPMIYFMDNCVHAIRTLPALQHDELKPEDVDCWVAGTMIETPIGPMPIESLQPRHIVCTPVGEREVLRSYLSGASETVWIETEDGRRLEGTPRHRVYVRGKGLVALENIECHDILQERITWSKSLNIAVSFIGAIRGASTTIRAAAGRAFTGRYGAMNAALSRMATTSTMGRTATTTIPLRTSNAFRAGSIQPTTRVSVLPVSLDSGSRYGVALMRGGPSSGTMHERCEPARLNGNARAAIVGVLSARDTLRRSFALLRAVPSALWSWCAQSAPSHSERSATPRSKFSPVRISAVGRCADRKPVYNLTVEDAHLFYANGVLSSNTEAEDHAPDEIRYACMSRPYLPKNQPKSEPVFHGIPIGGVQAPNTRAPTMSQLWADHDKERRAWR